MWRHVFQMCNCVFEALRQNRNTKHADLNENSQVPLRVRRFAKGKTVQAPIDDMCVGCQFLVQKRLFRFHLEAEFVTSIEITENKNIQHGKILKAFKS